MALRRALSGHLVCALPPAQPNIAARAHFRRELFTAPNSDGFFRRFLQRRSISDALPSFFTLPVGEELRERIRSMSVAGSGVRRVRLDGLRPPPAPEKEGFRVDAADAKRVLRFVQMEKIRERLRNIPASTIPYDEFVRICDGACGNIREMGSEFAKALDESGNVIVLGGVVFLHPNQVAKSMEKLISQSISMPNDPRRKELDHLRKPKDPDRSKSPVHGAWGTLLWVGLYDCPNIGLHEAYILGAELGRDGAHLLLCDLGPLCIGLHFLFEDFKRALI